VLFRSDNKRFGRWLHLLMGPAVSADFSAATGDITFSANPSAGQAIELNGVVIDFQAGASAFPHVQVKANLSATLDELVTVLQASIDADIAVATYTKTGGGTKLHIVYDTDGPAGNDYTLDASDCPVASASAATLMGGFKKHTFTSGALALPSASIELQHPDISQYRMNRGVMANTLDVPIQRKGWLDAKLGYIAQGEDDPTPSSGTVSPSTTTIRRYVQRMGDLGLDGDTIADIVNSSFNYSNGLDAVENISETGYIDGTDLGPVAFSGSDTIRYSGDTYDLLARSGQYVKRTYAWAFPTGEKITFTAPRVRYARRKKPLSGLKGIQQVLPWRASKHPSLGYTTLVEVVNDVADYAD